MTEVKTISQKQFDLLVPAQQKFYRELAAAGKVVIGDAPVRTDTTTAPVKLRSPTHRMLGKQVVVNLVTGEPFAGVLNEVWQYEIVVGDTVVLKHAVMTIHLQDVGGA